MRNYAGSAAMLLVTIAAAIGSYTVNLRVSGERAAVEGLRQRLVADAREIRNLQVELGTRARLPELQRWNDSVLQMSAPAANQFLRSPVQLASFGAPAGNAAAPALRYAVTTPNAAPAPAAPVEQTAYPAAAAPADAGHVVRASFAPPVAGRRPTPLPAADLAPSPDGDAVPGQ